MSTHGRASARRGTRRAPGGYTPAMHWLGRIDASPETAEGGASAGAPDIGAWPAVGLLIWAAVCLLPLDGDGVAWWAGRFVLLAALVWIPLALCLADDLSPEPVPRLVRSLLPWCALLLVGSFLLGTG